MIEAADAILDFWFGLQPEQWWKADDTLDAAIRQRFETLWCEQRQCPPETFLASPNDALAAAILFDQFPRNMYRGTADSFATDTLALSVAEAAVEREYDAGLPPERRQFLYMPFQHSEDIADQHRSLALFTLLGEPEQLRYAKLHHDVIARFGRFPHRNAMLGRAPRPKELAAGPVTPW